MRLRRDRRHRVGSGRGSVSSRMAPSTGFMTFAFVMMFTPAERRNIVGRSPATVFDNRGSIVGHPNVVVVSVIANGCDAAGQQER